MNLDRDKIISDIDFLERLLSNKKALLDSVNSKICKENGHMYGKWDYYYDYAGRQWYYERSCSICGECERSVSDPELRKILSHK